MENETTVSQVCMTPVGLEPTIPGSVGRCLIHWATGPVSARPRISKTEVTHLGGLNDRTAGLEPVFPGSEGRCLVHWARGPWAEWFQDSYTLVVIHLGGGSGRRCGPPSMLGSRGRQLAEGSFAIEPLVIANHTAEDPGDIDRCDLVLRRNGK